MPEKWESPYSSLLRTWLSPPFRKVSLHRCDWSLRFLPSHHKGHRGVIRSLCSLGQFAFQPYLNNNCPPLVVLQIARCVIRIRKMIFNWFFMGTFWNIYNKKAIVTQLKAEKHDMVILNYTFMTEHTLYIHAEHCNSSCTVAFQEITDRLLKSMQKFCKIYSNIACF